MKLENIKITHNKEENVNIIPFVDYYLPKYHPQLQNLTIKCLDEEIRNAKAPDYFVEGPGILVEVKRSYNRKEREWLINWSKNVARLQNILRNRDLSSIRGRYFIKTPSFLRVKDDKAKDIVDQVLMGIRHGQSSVTIGKLGNFGIEKFDDVGSDIRFEATAGRGGVINPLEVIHKNISNKIDDVNKKLSIEYGEISKRIWLLVSKDSLASNPDYIIDAFSQIFKKLLKSTFIDEIWLQLRIRDNSWRHSLIYLRSFSKDIENGHVHLNAQTIELFEKWFMPLDALGDIYKDNLFRMMRQVIGERKPFEVFENKFFRQDMLRLGNWLIDKERYDDAIWLIDKFIDDPDPGEPEAYQGDPKFNYHAKISAGETIHYNTTVLGRLALVIQKLCSRREYLGKGLRYTEILINHRNYYVKLQGLIPLSVIYHKRALLSGYEKRPYCEDYKRLHEIVIVILKFSKNNPQLKAFSRKIQYRGIV
jgi:hypothetical protein